MMMLALFLFTTMGICIRQSRPQNDQRSDKADADGHDPPDADHLAKEQRGTDGDENRSGEG